MWKCLNPGRLPKACVALALALGATAATAQTKPAETPQRYDIGRAATAQEIAGWDIDVRPDGQGLPPGRGSVKDGEGVYMSRCAACHGEFGEGAGRWPPLAGGRGSLGSHDPNRTVGSYFPYASSVFDYVRHAMPFGDAQSLKADELYAVVAYVLWLNDVVDETFVLSAETFRQVRLPNQAGFIDDDRETSERAFWQAQPCMRDCKGDVKVLNRAKAIDVTPVE
jgi:S-disulfanyl-L-cysteine oxidoreductase SoxD